MDRCFVNSPRQRPSASNVIAATMLILQYLINPFKRLLTAAIESIDADSATLPLFVSKPNHLLSVSNFLFISKAILIPANISSSAIGQNVW